MLPDWAGLYHLRKALSFTNAVPIKAGGAQPMRPDLAFNSNKKYVFYKNNVFCEYMYNIYDDIAPFVSIVVLLIPYDCFCLLFSLYLS